MKSRFLIVIVAVMLFIPALVAAQKNARHKVVIQFNDMDSVSQDRALRQIQNIRKEWADAVIEIVCLSGGLDLLTTKNSKASKQVAELTEKGVMFAACNNTMIMRNIKKEDLLPQAVVVLSAAIEILSKQEEGYSYFKSGK